MLERIPSQSDLTGLIGRPLYGVWQALCAAIEEKYDMDQIWSAGGRRWTYEYKYRRGGKTLCCLYARENCIGLMIIFGKDERVRFEELRSALPESVCKAYDEAETYHDGKWVMFQPSGTTKFADYMKLLVIKRKPNRK